MRGKFKIDTATLVVLAIAFSIIIILIVATLSAGKKGDGSVTTTPPPQLTYPPISDVPQREEITVSSEERTIEDKYEMDGIELIYSFVSYPYFQGGSAATTQKINDAILAFANDRVAIKSHEKTNAEDAYNRAQDDAMGFVEFEFVTTVESVYIKNGYLSIAFRRVRTVGLNEPSEFISTLCFDLLSGDEVDVSVFMNVDTDDAVKFIYDIFAQHIKINPQLYYNDALQTIEDIIDLKSFYLDDDGVILYFNPDIITPSVMGVRYFTVPYDKIGY